MESYKLLLLQQFNDRFVKDTYLHIHEGFVDAAFIIELFLMNHENKFFEANSIMSTPSVMTNIWNDLLCLENQFPFFVLQELFDLAFPDLICKDKNLPSLLELTFEFFSDYNMQNIKPNPHIRIKHFTNLLRIFYLPTDYEQNRSKLEFEQSGNNVLFHSASELHEKGVKPKAMLIRIEVLRTSS
ncbi:UPF0481 protein [Senna tora]|uniref:UPF0481 protein n=1 Tax=Senna tora TaxID=362788 RepID=A0A834TZP5_9FABA|nr:UPF0481 protein [Senna tora]